MTTVTKIITDKGAEGYYFGGFGKDVCEYYERGLLAPSLDYETPPPCWEEICDPLDSDGYVRVPQEPGMGYKTKRDYSNDNLVNGIT